MIHGLYVCTMYIFYYLSNPTTTSNNKTWSYLILNLNSIGVFFLSCYSDILTQFKSIELERQVQSESVKWSVNEFCNSFCWAKNPHSQAGLTIDTCKSIGGTLSLNCIQIKTNSGNAHRNDQYTPVSFVFKISQKSQIVNINKQQKIHSGNTDGFVDILKFKFKLVCRRQEYTKSFDCQFLFQFLNEIWHICFI